MSAPAELHDIETREDVERLVRDFYTKALTDPFIGVIFTDVAHLDVEAHVPQITSFWATILLGEQSYGSGAFRPHADLHAQVGLREGHFDRWLQLWFGTVDELYKGEKANQAKIHALRVARAFSERLKSFPSPLDPRPDAAGLPITHHG